MEEADVIGLTKIDLLEESGLHAVLDRLRQGGPRQGMTTARLCGISARNGEGIDEWWQALHEPGEAASVLRNIDYDLYARAEAAMGWLNARLRVELPADGAPGRSLSDFVADVAATVQQRSGLIGNFKVIAADAGGWLRAGVTRVRQAPDVEEGGFSGPGAGLIVNTRATLPAMDLHDIIMQNARRWSLAVEHVDYLHPSAPNPTYRYA